MATFDETTFDEIARRYLGAWNETDATARRTLVGAVFAADASYVDPMAVADGREAITATSGAVQDQFPGCTFRLTGAVDGHHEQLRFTWELGPAGEPAPVAGFDVAVLDADGRVQTVHGFLDRVPQA